jgi:hypothetical protein
MNGKIRKTMALLSAVCMLGVVASGCGSKAAPVAAAEKDDGDSLQETADVRAAEPAENTEHSDQAENNGNTAANGVEAGQEAADTDKAQGTTEVSGGRWHVLSPEVAAAADADFAGVVWKIEEHSFFIAEIEMEILEDGSVVSACPAPDADIPDSDLIPVVFDEGTHFYIRTIYDHGERYEDSEAVFSDLKTGVSIEMKGRFEQDVFYADEIRILKV